MADGTAPSIPTRPGLRSRGAGAWLMGISGFAGLGYQMVWTRQFAVWVGHEMPAVLALIAAIFGGFAVGAAGLGPRIARSRRPARWYAGCELAIALWSAALLVLLPALGAALQAAIGLQPSGLRQWGVTFAGALLVLLPATAAMGATVPAIDRIGRAGGAGGASVALPYAANTGGAVLGVLASAYGLVPVLGLNRTAAVCILLNLTCAAVAMWVLGGAAGSKAAPSVSSSLPPPGRRDLLRLAATGLLGIGYEVLVVRVLAQVSEDTVYTYADLLAVYLAGSALGAALYARLRDRFADRRRAADRLLTWLAAACLAGGATLWAADGLRAALVGLAGANMAAAIAAEAALALAAFALPTALMGALFALLCDHAAGRDGVGPPLAANTAGAALAPLVFGVVLAPALGPKLALVLVPLGYLALLRRTAWRAAAPWVPLGAAVLVATAAPSLAFVQVPEGGRLVDYREGTAAAVSVVVDAEGVARLRIDNRQTEGSSASRVADARQAWLPLLLHAAPQRALFLGLGTGVTAASAAVDPTLSVDAVELLPEVVAASPRFIAPILAGPAAARLRIEVADARRYVQVSRERYDVIVSDNFHPARSGSAALYTVEHFMAVRARLAPGGVFCQWLPLHQLDRRTLASIVRSFRVAFPMGAALLASNSLETPVIGLVGTADGHRFEPSALALRAVAFDGGPGDFGLDGALPVFGSFVAGPRALARFAEDAPLNTDDRPVVAWLAPRLTYAPDSTPAERLLALLREWRVDGDEVLAPGVPPVERARIDAYRAARDRFLLAGVGVRPTADVRRMLAQVQAPLLEALRLSPDFRPAREPLRRMAAALDASDPAAARALLAALPPDPTCAGASACAEAAPPGPGH